MTTPEDRSTTTTNDSHSHSENEKPKPTPGNHVRKFVWVGILRWFGTVVLGVVFYIIIFLHQGRTLTSTQKSIFDALIVAVSLALGLNSAASLRHIAVYTKHWLEGRPHDEGKEVEVYSFVALIQLLTKTPLPILKVACIVWLLLNFSIQTAISAIGLTFKAEPSIQDIYLDSTLGNVTIPDMSRFARVGRFFDSGRPQSIAAHMLGDSGADFAYSTLPSNSLAGTPVAQNPYEYWDAGGHWEFIFATSAPGAASAQDFNFLSVYSNQSVRSTATCRTPSYTFNDSSATLEIRTENQTILFPGEPLADEAMTYLTEPILSQNPDKPITTGICGPGCSTVHVLEPMTAQPVEDPESAFQPGSYFYYYQCNVTLTPVGGDDNHAGMFNLTPTAAAVAAQAIALSGARPPGPTANTTGTGMYTAYTLGLEFGQAQSNNATGMARMLSRFAIGVVAAAARTNPRMVVGGYPPRQGVRLVLDKPVAFGGILVATAVVQLGLLIGAVVAVLSGTGGKGDGNDGITRKREWDW